MLAFIIIIDRMNLPSQFYQAIYKKVFARILCLFICRTRQDDTRIADGLSYILSQVVKHFFDFLLKTM